MPTHQWHLCLQFGRLIHADGTVEWGYRYIWKDDVGNLRAQRAGARIPSFKMMDALKQKAASEGWGHLDADTIPEDATPEDALAPRKLALLDGENRLFCGTHREIAVQLWHHGWNGGFTDEDTVEKWMVGAAKRFREQYGVPLNGDDAIPFIGGLIEQGLYREISIGGKVY